MVNRCYDPKHKEYGYYGGLGIIVCEEWLNDRGSFLDWFDKKLAERPEVKNLLRAKRKSRNLNSGITIRSIEDL